MVVAWPGTGKTQVIALRTLNILFKTDIGPENIFITTFTESWVYAIQKRLQSFLWNQAYSIKVSTIHSFCYEIISTYPEKFLQYKTYSLIDEVEKLEILKQIITTLYENKQLFYLTSEHDTYFYLRNIQRTIDTLKIEGITPKDFIQYVEEQKRIYDTYIDSIPNHLKKHEHTKKLLWNKINKMHELYTLYSAYTEHLRKEWKYDFQDILSWVYEVLSSDEELQYFYAEKYQFIMVDEFQDINNLQYKIIHSICNISKQYESTDTNIMVVGDDDQSIYRFQWANVENMMQFLEYYPHAQVCILTINYRSTQSIINAYQKLISYNTKRLCNMYDDIEKNITAYKKNDVSSVYIFEYESQEEELFGMIRHIETLHGQHIPYEEIAIIVRDNSEVELISDILKKNGIPVHSKKNTNILENPFVTFIIHFLKVIHSPYITDEELASIMKSYIIDCNQKDVFFLLHYLYTYNYKKQKKMTLIELLHNLNTIKESLQNPEKIETFFENFLYFQQLAVHASWEQLLSEFSNRILLFDAIKKYGSFEDSLHVYSFFKKTKEIFEQFPTLSLWWLLEKLDLYREYRIPIPKETIMQESTWVQVLTAHASKWLEYEYVFIPRLFHKNWDNKKVIEKIPLPDIVAKKKQGEHLEKIEEERRLFFVACSRAKTGLYLSYSKYVSSSQKQKSMFLFEIEWIESSVKVHNKDAFETYLHTCMKPRTLNISLYRQEEIEYIQQFLQNYKLSASDLNLFIENPVSFLKYVIFKFPFQETKKIIFWNLFHRTLELLFLHYRKHRSISVDISIKQFERLLKNAHISWREYEQLLEKGKKALYSWYRHNAERIPNILHVEYNFFHKNIFFKDIPLTGKIDCIEKKGKFENSIDTTFFSFLKEYVRIIDYKTGNPKMKKETKEKYFRQLMFYKLLCDLDTNFQSHYIVESVALDFIEGYEETAKSLYEFSTYDTTFTDSYAFFQEELIENWKKIQNIAFWEQMLHMHAIF